MFIIKEGDQPETEAIDLTTLRAWAQAGRVNRGTAVRRAGETEWTRASELPELRDLFESPPIVPASPPPINRLAPSQRRMCTLAVVSLVLGILSLPTLGLAGLAGVICGGIAIGRIRKNRAELKGEGLAIAGIVFSSLPLLIVPVAISAGLLLPALAKAKQRAQTINCVNQMKQIVLAVRIYSNDHDEKFPPDLKALKNELIAAKLLICPGDGQFTQDRNALTWEDVDPGSISYEFITPGAEEGKLDPQTVVLRCPIHGNEGHADGSVHQRANRPR